MKSLNNSSLLKFANLTFITGDTSRKIRDALFLGDTLFSSLPLTVTFLPYPIYRAFLTYWWSWSTPVSTCNSLHWKLITNIAKLVVPLLRQVWNWCLNSSIYTVFSQIGYCRNSRVFCINFLTSKWQSRKFLYILYYK